MAKTIAIFSTKGGVGKTLIATNIAVSLAKDQMRRTCLIDFDLQLPGDMARMLNINPQKTAVNFAAYLHKATQSLNPAPPSSKRYDFLVKTALGLDFLAGVAKPQQASGFEADKIKEVFGFLGKEYDFIVVDIGKVLAKPS